MWLFLLITVNSYCSLRVLRELLITHQFYVIINSLRVPKLSHQFSANFAAEISFNPKGHKPTESASTVVNRVVVSGTSPSSMKVMAWIVQWRVIFFVMLLGRQRGNKAAACHCWVSCFWFAGFTSLLSVLFWLGTSFVGHVFIVSVHHLSGPWWAHDQCTLLLLLSAEVTRASWLRLLHLIFPDLCHVRLLVWPLRGGGGGGGELCFTPATDHSR